MSEVRVELIQGGRRPWSRKKKILVGGCAFFAFACLACCISSLLFVRGTFDAPFVEGERFCPPPPSAPENMLVVRADLADAGVSEMLPSVMAALTTAGSDAELPPFLKWAHEQNSRQSAQGIGRYSPVTVTELWDWAPVGSAATGDPAFDERREGVVVQYRGLARLLARGMGALVAKTEKKEEVDVGGRGFLASSPSDSNPDARELVHIGDRFIYANRTSIARGLADAGDGPETPRAASDPVTLLALLPKTRDVTGLHRGSSSARAVTELARVSAELSAVRAGKKLEDTTDSPKLPFDPAQLEVVAWSVDFEGNGNARVDIVLRFGDEAEAATAEKALGTDGEAWAWLREPGVPLERSEARRLDAKTVHATAHGRGLESVVATMAKDLRAYDRAQRARSWAKSAETPDPGR
jgi:hypothetical protein